MNYSLKTILATNMKNLSDKETLLLKYLLLQKNGEWKKQILHIYMESRKILGHGET